MRVTAGPGRSSAFAVATFSSIEEIGELLDELDSAVEHLNWTPQITRFRDQLKKVHEELVP